MRARNLILAAGAFVLGSGLVAASAQAPFTVTGPASAVNADTIRVGDEYVFLWGLESVERAQICAINGIGWECYAAAVRALESIIGVADVTCVQIGPPDYLNRWLGTCTVEGVDVNAALVRSGFAIAKLDETEDYVDEEEAAHAEGIGLWQGEFQPPAEFREAEGFMVDRP